MKNQYVKPEMSIEEFNANQVVAACGDTEYGQYKFSCDAGGGNYGGLYVKNASGNYTRVSNGSNTYHACNEWHYTSVNDDYREGIFDPDTNHNNGNEVNVLIWYKQNQSRRWENGHWVYYYNGTYTYQGHATEQLTRDSWTVVKS